MTVNRKISPPLSELSVPKVLPYTTQVLPNGIEMLLLHDPDQEVFKMDVVFDAGAYYQKQPLVATTAINMLNEGTIYHNSAEIAEIFDYYGAYVDFNCGMHKAELNLLSLNKFAEETIPILAEILSSSTIPAHELDIYLCNKKQQFLVEKQKTAWLAQKEFARLLFGTNHPYANTVKEEDYDRITPEIIREFYKERLNAENCFVLLSGNITPEIRHITTETFGKLSRPGNTLQTPVYALQPALPGRSKIEKEDAVQTSIRIGKKGVRLTDEDYAGFLLLNTVLGGYFGSRLMSNIREEKGYTYGIHSFNVSLPETAYWCVATDVDNKYTEATIEEVLKEIRTLRSELIPEAELNLVKNFFHGDLLREIDGVFAQSDALKHKLPYGIDNCFYSEIIHKIKQCNAPYLRELAEKYLNPEQLYIVTAGKHPYN